MFGEGEATTRFWPSLRAAALEGRDFNMSAGVQVRDFIHVSEVARKFLQALEFEGVEPGRPHLRNVGTGRAQSLLDFARHWWSEWHAIGQLQPSQVGLRPGELARLVANVDDVAIG